MQQELQMLVAFEFGLLGIGAAIFLVIMLSFWKTLTYVPPIITPPGPWEA